MYIPDGQDKDHLIRCYINTTITDKDNPILILRSISMTQPTIEAKPIAISQDQCWQLPTCRGAIPCHGTLLLFDLSKQIRAPIYIPSRRFTPMLIYKRANRKFFIIASSVAIGNIKGTIFWAVITGLLLVLTIGFIIRRVTGTALAIICNHKGKLSLARTQILVWTIVTASMIFGFGLIEITIPSIPLSVIALMGLSLVTGNIKALLAKEWRQLSSPNIMAKYYKPKLVDLFTDETGRISIAKIQMTIWTVITLVLFILKSILEGCIWSVPWAMVALMGMSQLGYLIPDVAIRTTPFNDREVEK